MYAYKDTGGLHIVTVGDGGAYTSIALDGSGNPHIGYQYTDNSWLMYAHYQTAGLRIYLPLVIRNYTP